MQLTILFYALLTASACAVQVSATSDCVHPPNRKKIVKKLYKDIFRDYFQGQTTYNVIPEYRNIIRAQYAKPQRNKAFSEANTHETYIYGSSVCPRFRRQVNQPVNSTCPHFIVLNVDKQREPRSIAKAKCSCNKCLRLDTHGHRREATARCNEVSTYVPVVRWKCPKSFKRNDEINEFEYVIELEKVPVGCTCERAKSVRG